MVTFNTIVVWSLVGGRSFQKENADAFDLFVSALALVVFLESTTSIMEEQTMMQTTLDKRRREVGAMVLRSDFGNE